ncbi:helix-turn-helix domain-containing protein [Niallia nealsonii]|uniref:Transcriptional regulator n=1 Tax=Niallia nealsonii TaxID=115979 RepID=A0A2N0Z0Z6_9BACI|nr:helix-turn-helix transcriptional regulator [Niallia nealsonii]PKG23192.1 transcriptional regulator [Niallia nealsonii]
MLKTLQELRKKKNWSQQETADMLGIAKSTYAGYESGYREPSLRALIQIADLFNVSIDYILNRTSPASIIELTSVDSISLTVDQQPLSTDEINNLIAFTRIKRGL